MRAPRALHVAVLLMGLVLLACAGPTPTATPPSPTPTAQPTPTPQPTPTAPLASIDLPSVRAGAVRDPRALLASHYAFNPTAVAPRAPSYALPLKTELVSNLGAVQSTVGLGEKQVQQLLANGFVVIPWSGEDVTLPYGDLYSRKVPLFVTSDTVLHLYHVAFAETLRRVEEEEFFDLLTDQSKAMLDRAEQDYRDFPEGRLREAARRNVAYFAVALSLLQTPTGGPLAAGEKPPRTVDFRMPGYAAEDVQAELDRIQRRTGFEPSAIFNTSLQGGCGQGLYCEDYSQYQPRGHYTRSEKLRRYFMAMMWYGRMAFLLRGGDEALVSQEDSDIATAQAALIAAEMPGVRVGTGTAMEAWQRVYAVTSFFVEAADDLTPHEYLAALETVFGRALDPAMLANDDALLLFRAELAKMKSPAIFGGSSPCLLNPPLRADQLNECLDKSRGMRFLGQRFIPDSYAFQRLVMPSVGPYVGSGQPFTVKLTQAGLERTVPRGLDFMAALGSQRAYDVLKAEGDTDYRGADTSYDSQLDRLRSEFSSLREEDWSRTLYWGWLRSFKPLLEEYPEGYPAFMRTEAWQDKSLRTALASWTELRHDTILYAKQSYTAVVTSVPPPAKGYVEPVPELYARLGALARMTREGLQGLDAIEEFDRARLSNLEQLLARLQEVSVRELRGEAPTDADTGFFTNLPYTLHTVVTGVEPEGLRTAMVADVHTDPNDPAEVLEEGVGNVELVVVAVPGPDGALMLAAGPVLSYYEFKQPMSDRLTDEAWRQMLKDDGPEPPRWTGSFYRVE